MVERPTVPLKPRFAARPVVLRYAIALLVIGVAAVLTSSLRARIDDPLFFLPFTAAVAMAAWFGGLGPGLLVTAAGALVNVYYFVEPYGSMTVPDGADQLRLLVFVAVTVLLSVVIDSRTRAARRSAAQHLWWRVALASLGDGVIVADAEGRVAFMNSVSEELSGWAAAEAAGKPLGDVFHIVDAHTRETAENPVEKALHAGRAVGLGNRTLLIRRDGSELGIDDSAAPVRDSGGRLLGVVLVYRDVTQRRAAERALDEQAQRLRLQSELLDHAYDAVFVRDERQCITYWNPASVELYGYSEAEAIGRSAHALLKTEFPVSAEEVAETLRESGHWAGELVHTTRDGRQVTVDSRHVLVPGPDRRTRVLEINRDVTERKAAQEREQRALREAQEANRLKDEFLATLSHELRTPLNAIHGWTQMLLTGRLDEATTRRAYETIDRNTKAQTQLIGDILDVSRIITGKLRLELEGVDLIEVLETAVESVRPAADARRLRIATKYDVPAAQLMGDRARLEQVFWNLLSNAVKFTPADGRIDVAVERVDSKLQVRVSDTGVGIRPEFLPHVFERFTQSDASASRLYGGLGLGLAITRHLVEAHGGSVTVDSAGEGRGATFTVALPIRATVGPGVSHSLAAGALAADAPGFAPSLTGTSVLVVDDEADARELLDAVLRRQGATVWLAESSAQGLAMLQQHRPDVLLSDIGMAGEDGYAFIRKVRALPVESGGATPAVALTAYARTEDRLRTLAAGYQQHIAKPVVPAELGMVIRALAAPSGRATE